MKILIMGCGRTGAQLASMLDADGHQITILDTNDYSFHRLPPDFKGTALVGDGTSDETLMKAGIEKWMPLSPSLRVITATSWLLK